MKLIQLFKIIKLRFEFKIIQPVKRIFTMSFYKIAIKAAAHSL